MQAPDEQDDMRQIPNYSRFLPIANINRIMKKALPENAKIAKDAKETVQECVSEFISFITSEACEKCKNEKRKTINGEDLLFAINTLGFESYVDILKLYLNKYRDKAVKACEGQNPSKQKRDRKEEEDDDDDEEDEIDEDDS
ncbi:Nuclear transcription factor Y subunit B-2 [Paramecium bursaria]